MGLSVSMYCIAKIKSHPMTSFFWHIIVHYASFDCFADQCKENKITDLYILDYILDFNAVRHCAASFSEDSLEIAINDGEALCHNWRKIARERVQIC